MKFLYATFVCLFLSFASIEANAQAGKIWYADNHLYVNIVKQGVLVYDNTIPESPEKIGFISIPGNIDIAVEKDMLYANHHEDLVVINISQIQTPQVLKREPNIFPQYRHRGDKGKIAFNPPGNEELVSSTLFMSNSVGGSMACFAIVGKHLFALNKNAFTVFQINGMKTNFRKVRTVQLGGNNLKTIFPMNGNLLIGASDGVHIYNISNAANPVKLSKYEHLVSCDPVVGQGRYAFATLRTGSKCRFGRRGTNQLDIIDLSNPRSPKRAGRSIPMTNPKGLGIDGNQLFVCDGRNGLKIYDVSMPGRPQFKTNIRNVSNPFDVIVLKDKNLLIVSNGDDIRQFSYTDSFSARLISTMDTKY